MIHTKIVCNAHSPGKELSLLGVATAAHSINDPDKNILEDVFGKILVFNQEQD
jgi:hypothetical protein